MRCYSLLRRFFFLYFGYTTYFVMSCSLLALAYFFLQPARIASSRWAPSSAPPSHNSWKPSTPPLPITSGESRTIFNFWILYQMFHVEFRRLLMYFCSCYFFSLYLYVEFMWLVIYFCSCYFFSLFLYIEFMRLFMYFCSGYFIEVGSITSTIYQNKSWGFNKLK